MKETKDNLVNVCPDCKKEMIKSVREQLDLNNITIKTGDIVKTTYVYHRLKVKESMWASITKIEDGQYYGKLDNEPFYATLYRYGKVYKLDMDTLSGFIRKDGDTEIRINPLESTEH